MRFSRAISPPDQTVENTENNKMETTYIIYPNPANNQEFFKDISELDNLSFRDSSGKFIRKKTLLKLILSPRHFRNAGRITGGAINN